MRKDLRTETRELEFGKFYMYEGIIPCIVINEIRYLGEIKTTKAVGYLSAFRNYCFQVSETYDGVGDKGSTPVFGLDTFESVIQKGRSNLSQGSTIRYFISSIAYMAIISMTQCVNISVDESTDESINIQYIPPKYHEINSCRCNEEWRMFINSCYDRYVVGNRTPVENAPYYDNEKRKVVEVEMEEI